MEVTNEALPWSSEDESKWNNFLNSDTGRRLIPKLAEFAPALLDGAHANKTLVRNGELRGFQVALRELINLSHAQPLPPTFVSPYPSLENDAAWEDGEKLNQPPKQ
jgi:hypothetical protein